MIRRTPGERLAAWFATGPVGHLYGTTADIVQAWTRWAAGRVRARVNLRLRAGAASRSR